MTKSLISHSRKGTSDKVYMYCLEKVKFSGPTSDSVYDYIVYAYWGRNGNTLKRIQKFSSPDLDSAKTYQTLAHSGRVKDHIGEYQDIDDSNYGGGLTRNCPFIFKCLPTEERDHLTFSGFTKDEVSDVNADEVSDVEVNDVEVNDDKVVTCVNNMGLEDNFDDGSDYVAMDHSEDGMIYVYDRYGNKQECFDDRFVDRVAAL